mmetsp:Transcript_131178/g.261806  ORF Transcript_131178/g.261806 Transcript_131178/m.261806 type:complete len:163 (+) Transcript_131178:317-805(+)
MLHIIQESCGHALQFLPTLLVGTLQAATCYRGTQFPQPSQKCHLQIQSEDTSDETVHQSAASGETPSISHLQRLLLVAHGPRGLRGPDLSRGRRVHGHDYHRVHCHALGMLHDLVRRQGGHFRNGAHRHRPQASVVPFLPPLPQVQPVVDLSQQVPSLRMEI